MEFGGMRALRSHDRRRAHRKTLRVAVQVNRSAEGEQEVRPLGLSESVDLSMAGVFVWTTDPGPFNPGDVLAVSISIPWESRRLFPFSRIVGSCRVVRAEPVMQEPGPTMQVPGEEARWGLALEFCGDRPTMLGAIVM